MSQDFEFYETPAAFTRWLFRVMAGIQPIAGTVFEPCVGDGAILRAAGLHDLEFGVPTRWLTNDLDERWSATFNLDAAAPALWETSGIVDWTVSNPPFTQAIAIVTQALVSSRVGVAIHLRASIHEVLRTGIRRTWFAEHPPTGILWLPRFAYQRSKTTGEWSTDSVCACWVIWLTDPRIPKFIEYAPESVLDELTAETPTYRARMDALTKERAA